MNETLSALSAIDNILFSMESLPSRGETGKPGTPDAKLDSVQKFKKNQRSAEAREKRVDKRRHFRKSSRENLKLLRNSYIQQGLSLIEIRSKFKESRRVRKGGAFNPLPRLKVDEN